MKNVLVCCLILIALVAARARASEYICELSLTPPVVDPARGNSGYIAMYTSQQPNCSGQTAVYSICSKGATSHACGVNAQYTEATLIAVYESLRSAEVSQHAVVPYWNACITGGGNCTGGVLLYPEF
jgi:hypothetical protein